MQLVVDVEIGPPLLGRVLVVARHTAALGADKRCFGGRPTFHRWDREATGRIDNEW